MVTWNRDRRQDGGQSPLSVIETEGVLVVIVTHALLFSTVACAPCRRFVGDSASECIVLIQGKQAHRLWDNALCKDPVHMKGRQHHATSPGLDMVHALLPERFKLSGSCSFWFSQQIQSKGYEESPGLIGPYDFNEATHQNSIRECSKCVLSLRLLLLQISFISASRLLPSLLPRFGWPP